MSLRNYNAAAAIALAWTAITQTSPARAEAASAVKPGDIEQVVITASPLSNARDDIASIVGQVSRDQILRSGGANLADVLGEMPGVTGSSFASGASRPVIRGFDVNRVRILENGVGSFDVSDVGPDHGVPIDPLSTQRVEVVRGAATLRYGGQAIGGVVNAINNRIPLEQSGKPITAEVTGSYGSGADARQGSAMFDAEAGAFAFHADGFGRRTGDYGVPGGRQSNSFFHGDGYSAGSSYFFGASRIGAAVVHYDAKYGISGKDSFIDMKQTKGLFGSSLTINSGALDTLNIDAGYADYKHSEVDPRGHIQLATLVNKEWDARVEALFGAFGPFTAAALGAQVQRKDFSALGEVGDYLFPTATRSAAGFAFAEMPLVKGLRLQFGARVEHGNVEGTPASNAATDRGFTPVSGSVGAVFDASDAVKLGLTAASAARVPGQTELFARGPHGGAATYETGDPTQGVERANSLEGTIRLRVPKVEFEGAVWGAMFNNYIFGRLTGRTCNEGGNCVLGSGEALKELLYEQRSAAFWGLESKANIDLYKTPAGTVSGLVLADYVRAKLKGAGNVPRIPPYHVAGGLGWNSSKIDTSFLLRYTGAQNRVSFAETRTKGYVSLDAQLAWRPSAHNPGIELSVVGRNLTNRVQRNAVSLNKDEVMLPGRDVRIVLRAAF